MIKLNNAWLCINCECIFDKKLYKQCPICASKINYPLTKWIGTVKSNSQLEENEN